MESQKQLVQKINTTYGEIESTYLELSKDWISQTESQISDCVKGFEEAIALARSGMKNPTDTDEWTSISNMIETLENHCFEADKALRDKASSEEKHISNPRKARPKSKPSGRLDTITEERDEDIK
ncbi:hypothetical protein CIB48_g6302 [Xylaria polymorpha]|nr:hypothetical protein CIB48_g6302 [Xylaria polymorpha]